jgi:hypothetical protein
MAFQSDEPGVLATWSYTMDEWKAFVNWKKRRTGFFSYLLHFMDMRKNDHIPTVIISKEHITIEGKQESFFSRERHLRRVNIKEAGAYNIMEMMYENRSTSEGLIHEIYVPVPKGKLKEAIWIQEELLKEVNTREPFSDLLRK